MDLAYMAHIGGHGIARGPVRMAAMRMLAMTVVVLVLSSSLHARAWVTVYRCDEKTPLVSADPNHPHVYTDIMVGSKLVLVVSSDVGESWWGSLQYPEEDEMNMSLTGRGYDTVRRSFAGSCLPAVGRSASVRPFNDLGMSCLDLTTSLLPMPGDWFILDYHAKGVGTYDLWLYDLNVDWTVPVEVLSFIHVPSYDFDGNGIVDFEDFALLASHRPFLNPVTDEQTSVVDPNSAGPIDFQDLVDFGGHWLERTTCDIPIDPNQTPQP